MKYIYILLAFIFIFSASLKGQNYTFRYNPYSGYNNDQLELALKQSQKLERSGKIWTAMGTGMLVGGAVMTFSGINNISYGESGNYTKFGIGLGIMCFSGFPLGYGFVAWITGSEKVNLIEIELLAINTGTLNLKPTENGIGLVLAF